MGYDIGNRTDIQFDPTALGPNFSTTPLGGKIDTRTQLKTYTVNTGFSANFRLTSSLASRPSVGVQYGKDVFFQNQANGQRLSFGSKDIDGAAILTASQTTTTTVKLGGYIEQQLTWKDRLFLTGALRADDNSSFGADFNTVVFPKASVSYVISDEPFFPKGSMFSLFRLRGAYGQSGLQPGATDALTFFSPTASAVNGASTSAVTFGGLGLAGLKPEKSRERELGRGRQLLGRPAEHRGDLLPQGNLRRPDRADSGAVTRRLHQPIREPRLGAEHRLGADPQRPDHQYPRSELGCDVRRQHHQEQTDGARRGHSTGRFGNSASYAWL